MIHRSRYSNQISWTQIIKETESVDIKARLMNMVDNQVPDAIIYFYYNNACGNYNNLPKHIKENDKNRLSNLWPEYVTELNYFITITKDK